MNILLEDERALQPAISDLHVTRHVPHTYTPKRILTIQQYYYFQPNGSLEQQRDPGTCGRRTAAF